jgi:hypothetical protein
MLSAIDDDADCASITGPSESGGSSSANSNLKKKKKKRHASLVIGLGPGNFN